MDFKVIQRGEGDYQVLLNGEDVSNGGHTFSIRDGEFGLCDLTIHAGLCPIWRVGKVEKSFSFTVADEDTPDVVIVNGQRFEPTS